ncbi:hypothetical protein GCM10011363_24640 [Marivita lacus]|uniref:Uncharacterized protein n=1 Tax=Marivita lacus TaxID=1323742 RepID=A0ABQ1KQI8_9RHOB|nr:hypothetical protein [Marivita lacus]GGC06988.1 hypothetical protein GCM10011363_24640 [Marivita lacus]
MLSSFALEKRGEDLFFIHSGLLRDYFSDPAANGEERTGQFFDEGSIVTDAASFISTGTNPMPSRLGNAYE